MSEFDGPTNWKERFGEATRKIVRQAKSRMGQGSSGFGGFSESLAERTREITSRIPRKVEPMAIFEGLARSVRKRNAGFYGKLLTLLLCAWFLADVASVIVGRYIPEPAPARASRFGTPGGFGAPAGFGTGSRPRGLDDYGVIVTRNLFNSDGKMPGDDTSNAVTDQGGAPVRTTLPFNLIGTLILRDELRSIATIEDKTAASVYPVRVQDEIPQKARILSIDARKVVFVNLASGRREFVDIPEDQNSTAPRITLGGAPRAAGTPGAGIERVAPNQFNVSRAEVDKAIGNINQVLTQARAVPNFENGMPSGYKLFQIVPGSIYEKLGLQNGDVLMGMNGETINDPGKAFELLSQLKTATNLSLTLKRDGKPQEYSYEIR